MNKCKDCHFFVNLKSKTFGICNKLGGITVSSFSEKCKAFKSIQHE